jgi:hypothetical protein
MLNFTCTFESLLIVLPGREEHVAELDLVPVGDVQLEETHIDEDTLMSTPVSTIRISVDLEHQGDMQTTEERRKEWLGSFEKCCRATTHSLEFPPRFDLHQGLTGFGGMENFDADKYQRAMGAGVPFPKSPSMQIQAYITVVNGGEAILHRGRGKREIGGRSRFKEVFLEMQRDER